MYLRQVALCSAMICNNSFVMDIPKQPFKIKIMVNISDNIVRPFLYPLGQHHKDELESALKAQQSLTTLSADHPITRARNSGPILGHEYWVDTSYPYSPMPTPSPTLTPHASSAPATYPPCNPERQLTPSPPQYNSPTGRQEEYKGAQSPVQHPLARFNQRRPSVSEQTPLLAQVLATEASDVTKKPPLERQRSFTELVCGCMCTIRAYFSSKNS